MGLVVVDSQRTGTRWLALPPQLLHRPLIDHWMTPTVKSEAATAATTQGTKVSGRRKRRDGNNNRVITSPTSYNDLDWRKLVLSCCAFGIQRRLLCLSFTSYMPKKLFSSDMIKVIREKGRLMMLITCRKAAADVGRTLEQGHKARGECQTTIAISSGNRAHQGYIYRIVNRCVLPPFGKTVRWLFSLHFSYVQHCM